ncbi:MAG: alpha/beta hydrolase [Pseudomonadota bacterium]
MIATLAYGAAGLVLFYACILLGMYLAQRQLIYVADPTHSQPQAHGLSNVRERVLRTADGETLVTWWRAAQSGQPTILYFHGNAGTLAYRAPRIAAFEAQGWGVVMMSYRGFSGSSGRPSQEAIFADAKLALDALLATGTRPGDIILYGESLGAAVAARLATQASVGGMILEAPFTSLVDVAARQYPWLWVRPFVVDRFETVTLIGRIEEPTLIIHGARDGLIPVEMGRALYAKAGAHKKQLVVLDDAMHSDVFEHGAMEAIAAFVAKVRARGQ